MQSVNKKKLCAETDSIAWRYKHIFDVWVSFTFYHGFSTSIMSQNTKKKIEVKIYESNSKEV